MNLLPEEKFCEQNVKNVLRGIFLLKPKQSNDRMDSMIYYINNNEDISYPVILGKKLSKRGRI